MSVVVGKRGGESLSPWAPSIPMGPAVFLGRVGRELLCPRPSTSRNSPSCTRSGEGAIFAHLVPR